MKHLNTLSRSNFRIIHEKGLLPIIPSEILSLIVDNLKRNGGDPFCDFV